MNIKDALSMLLGSQRLTDYSGNTNVAPSTLTTLVPSFTVMPGSYVIMSKVGVTSGGTQSTNLQDRLVINGTTETVRDTGDTGVYIKNEKIVESDTPFTVQLETYFNGSSATLPINYQLQVLKIA